MPRILRSIFVSLKQTASAWFEEELSRLGAALAFYALFAVAPLFVIVLSMASLWFGESAARNELFSQVSGLVGSAGAEAIQALVSSAYREPSGVWATTVAVVTLFAVATGVLVHLQSSLNLMWGVERRPNRGLQYFLQDRLLSLAIILGLGFLLLVVLIFSAGLAALEQFIGEILPAQDFLWRAIDSVVSFGIVTLLFAMIFKVLPDVKLAWRDAWMGALITALLFHLGKLLFGLYLGHSNISSAYGAAGSLVVALMWIYYSAQILFFGAKFTQIYSQRHGTRVEPSLGAEVTSPNQDAAGHAPQQ